MITTTRKGKKNICISHATSTHSIGLGVKMESFWQVSIFIFSSSTIIKISGKKETRKKAQKPERINAIVDFKN